MVKFQAEFERRQSERADKREGVDGFLDWVKVNFIDNGRGSTLDEEGSPQQSQCFLPLPWL